MKNTIINIITLGVSISALCVSYCRAEPFEIELVGVLATILSMLVTILIGWNIYSFIEVKKINKKIKKERRKQEIENYKNLSLLHLSIALPYAKIGVPATRINYDLNILKSILYAEKSNSYKTCNHLNNELSNIRVATIGFYEDEELKINKIKSKIDIEHLKEIGNFKSILDFLA